MSRAKPIHVVDCTLREGEQTAGVWFSVEEKLELLDLLVATGVEFLDAGMPAVSADERRFLSEATGRSVARIGASVRALVDEVRLAVSSGCDEIFVICPVSELHRTRRLRLDEDGLQRRIESVVREVAKSQRTCNVVLEDASRTEMLALERAMRTALSAGADRIFICDTVGVWTPSLVAEIVLELREQFADVPLGVHCHNDFGMATANTIAAIENGCDWPTVTVNGVGERAGNASFVEVVAATEHILGYRTKLDFGRFTELSRLVEHLTGFIVPQHQPLVGWNAHRHESGIHVDGLLKEPKTYEPLDPEILGATRHYVFGKHTGSALLRRLAQVRGWPDDDGTIARVLEMLKSERVDGSRELFDRVRAAIDQYNDACLGVPESRLQALFLKAARSRSCPP
jgi:isopropylmalate/homocitrate/citramalate synthase